MTPVSSCLKKPKNPSPRIPIQLSQPRHGTDFAYPHFSALRINLYPFRLFFLNFLQQDISIPQNECSSNLHLRKSPQELRLKTLFQTETVPLCMQTTKECRHG